MINNMIIIARILGRVAPSNTPYTDVLDGLLLPAVLGGPAAGL